MLGRAAEEFASVLTDIVNRTVTTDAQFVVTPLEDEDKAWIYQLGSTVLKQRSIPLSVGSPAGQEAPLWLRAAYRVQMDASAEYLQVDQSVFGLCINRDTDRCVMRLEYDRDRGSEPGKDAEQRHNRPAAHVQIQGVSVEYAYALGRLGRKLEPLEKLHVPVGGRRFRPTLEDFIEFLAVERLLPGTKPGWREALEQHRGDWLRNQLKAAVRNDPHVAAAQLRKMRWELTEPA